MLPPNQNKANVCSDVQLSKTIITHLCLRATSQPPKTLGAGAST
jgi:hypothetical protein